jgi:hypothetical protein
MFWFTSGANYSGIYVVIGLCGEKHFRSSCERQRRLNSVAGTMPEDKKNSCNISAVALCNMTFVKLGNFILFF